MDSSGKPALTTGRTAGIGEAIRAVEADFQHESTQARKLAVRYFDAQRVLRDLLTSLKL